MTLPKTAPFSAAVAVALLALLTPRPALGAASEWSVNKQSQVRLITAWKVAPKNGELWMGLQFRLSPGWHVYWKNSGDAGFPPAVTFQPADVLGKPELLWPTPHRFDLPGGLVAFGYADGVIYPVRAQIGPAEEKQQKGTEGTAGTGETPGEILKITADLDYLVCQVDCVPFRYTLTLDQPWSDAPESDPETAPLLQAELDRLPRTTAEVAGVTTGAVLDAGRAEGPDLEIRVLGVHAEAGKTDLFLETNNAFDAGRPRMKIAANGVVFHVPMKAREANKPLPGRTPIAWTVSNLVAKDGRSFNLESQRDVEVWTKNGGPAGGAKPQPAATPGRLARLLLSALLGGALLNLTPPVLALLVAELFVLRGAGERGRVREGAAAATTGIVGSAWIVAGLALAAHRMGLPAGWGAQLQEPVVAALLAVAAAVLALNLWGVVEVPLAPVQGEGAASTSRHLLAGLFATPLALAWPVPLLQEPVGYALSRGPATVAAVFAVVGFGLALPYLLLAAVPVVPVPGSAERWVPRLREGLGFLAGAGAFWVLYALSHQVSAEGLAGIELTLLAMALLAWLRHREGSGRAFRAALAVGLLASAAGALWLADRNRLAPRPAVSAPTTVPRGTLSTSGG
ncbi:MAG TPA: protein-disulfide reductase DsbD domain-containing protein [Thermoanaerobaculia bacterium]|nr:protein-disulfide reductase DsbD domain-containing protein [Thermoanaerobaculia bacterium]